MQLAVNLHPNDLRLTENRKSTLLSLLLLAFFLFPSLFRCVFVSFVLTVSTAFNMACPFMAIHTAMDDHKTPLDSKNPLRCPISGRAIDTPKYGDDKSGSEDKKVGMRTIFETVEEITADGNDRDQMVSPRSSAGSLRSQSAPSQLGSHVASRKGSHIGSHIGSIASAIQSNLPPASRLLLFFF
jgi:hypothetical protein